MTGNAKPLGNLRPLGGGDPIPLKKEVLVVGRRPSCDIRLDFENISGKHCELRFSRGVWYVRDLNSTNGTTLNGQKVVHNHGVMPDDELGLATHFFAIDYEPIAPSSLVDANAVLEEEMGETRRSRSLMELAGLESSDRDRSRRERPEPAPSRPAQDDSETDFETEFEEVLPDGFHALDTAPASSPVPPSDAFLDIIREDLQEPRKNPRKSK
jgi:pSer/pThr/pTyr-binding forkhead associated (FHA) protein